MYRERKNIRLKDRDYSSEGIYFITICCRERKSFFGKIENKQMHSSDIGRIASQYWMEIPTHFPHVRLDEFTIMPNHLHGIIILDYSMVGTCHGMSLPLPHDGSVGSRHGVALPAINDNTIESRHDISQPTFHKTNQFSKPIKNSVSVIVNQYKSSVKRWCNKNGFNNFSWQSRFYDHIVYDEWSIQNIRIYIKNNPSNWKDDELFI